jgi:hypothetical protein
LDLLRRSLLFVTSRSAEWPNCLLWWSDDRSWLTALDHAGDQFLSQGVGDASVRPEAGEVVQFVGIGLQVVEAVLDLACGGGIQGLVLTWGRIYGYVPYCYRALTGMLHFCNLASSRRV